MSRSPIDPDDLRPLMYWTGLSLHASQTFEYGMKLVIFMLAEIGSTSISREEAVGIIEGQAKTTLGQLVHLLKNRVTVSEGWLTALQAGLEARNHIVHRFLTDNAERISDPGSRPAVLRELKSLRKTVLEGQRAVDQMHEVLYHFAGLDYGKILDSVHEEVRLRNLKQ